MWVQNENKFGWLLLHAFSRLYGGKEIEWCLITRLPTLKKLKLIFLAICGIGQICIVLLTRLLLWIFWPGLGVRRAENPLLGSVFVFFLVPFGSLLFTSYVLFGTFWFL